MADDAEEVAKLVQLKLEDYFNRRRVETEFDPSGKGIHTTPSLVAQLESSYRQLAEKQWKSNKKKRGIGKREKGEKKEREVGSSREEEEMGLQDGARTSSPREDGRRGEGRPGPKTAGRVKPSVSRTTTVKSKVKGSEIERITRNARATLAQVSIDRIHSVHRYRPNLTAMEYVDLAKSAHVSKHVSAILNTEHAFECAEEYDDREAARDYVKEQNELIRQQSNSGGEARNSAGSRQSQKSTPLWPKMEMQREHQKPQSVGGSQKDEEEEEEEEMVDKEENSNRREANDESELGEEGNKISEAGNPDKEEDGGRSLEDEPLAGTEPKKHEEDAPKEDREVLLRDGSDDTGEPGQVFKESRGKENETVGERGDESTVKGSRGKGPERVKGDESAAKASHDKEPETVRGDESANAQAKISKTGSVKMEEYIRAESVVSLTDKA